MILKPEDVSFVVDVREKPEDEDDALNNVCAKVRITQNSWRCADGIR